MSYTAYRSMDELWLTSIPKHWDSRKIKYAFAERVEKGYPDEPLLVASQNMGVVPKEIYGNRTVEATKDLHNLKLVRVGDFVISLRSFQGGLEYAYYQGIISPAYTVMIPNDHISSGYFRFLAKSRLFIELLQMCVTGIREGQNIDYSKLKNHQIPLPPRDEQDQIVHYLDWKVSQINKLINVKRRQIALLQEQKRAVINEAVTKGGKEWKTAHLRSILTPISEKGYSDLPLLSVVREQGIILRNIEDKEENHNFVPDDLSGYKRVQRGQFVMNKMKAWQGSYGVSSYDGIVSPAYYVFDLKFEYPEFFHRAVRSRYYVDKFAQFSIGIRIGQWDLPVGRIKEIEFLYPPLEEQQKIVTYLDQRCANIDKLATKLNEEIILFTECRTRLISDVVIGKLDVRSVTVPEYETVEETAGEYSEIPDDDATETEADS